MTDATPDTAPSPAPRSGPPGRDLTSGPILKTLALFAAPTLASNVLQSLNGSINSIWVGRLLGDAALAATANANIVMFLVFATVFGFGMAATVKVGQSFGARNLDAARRTFGTALGFCGGLAIIVATAGWILAPQLLTALATPGESYGLALAYLRVIFISMPAGMISVMLAMGLRGGGDARTPLLFMILTVVIDVILNPLLIAGIGPFPRLGIAGSALSTAIANTAGLVATLAYIYVRDLPLRLRGAELRYLIPARAELGYIVGKGLPMGAQMLIISGAGIIMVGIVNREGLIATAAYGASLQLWNYLQMPAMAIGAAVSAMAAQAIGAKMPDRLHKITGAGITLNLVMTGFLTAMLLLFDRPALVLFLGPDSPAVPLARHIQLLASWTFILFGVTIVLFGTMRAAGVVYAPLITLAISMYPVRLGFYEAMYERLGMDAIWLAFGAGSIVSMGLAITFYLRRGWRENARPKAPDEASECCEADGEPAGRLTPAL
jgi:putative MATE family efflux protein